ncbi:asparagine synthase-related protein [Micromonospora echinospora]|uniref:asparagine synthase-related protein n=1 Tax=Micromonospora echinospora TaxID=1877 RepID=UPI003A86FDE4
MDEATPIRPTGWDVCSGVVLGHVSPPEAPPRTLHSGPRGGGTEPRPASPLAALEEAVLPALRRPPCLVSFSGGLDSSLVLAVAVRVARRAGLPEPVPATWRFTGAPRADESDWQDRVVAALGCPSWQVLRADDDLDLTGPVARRMLLRHGLLHPANAHLHLPVVELASGGSVLTGAGGDQSSPAGDGAIRGPRTAGSGPPPTGGAATPVGGRRPGTCSPGCAPRSPPRSTGCCARNGVPNRADSPNGSPGTPAAGTCG